MSRAVNPIAGRGVKPTGLADVVAAFLVARQFDAPTLSPRVYSQAMPYRSTGSSALLMLFSMLALAVPPARGDVLWTLLRQQADPPSTYSYGVMVRDSRRARFIASTGVYRSYFHGPILGYNPMTWSLDLADTVKPWRPMLSATGSPLVEWAAATYDSVSDKVFVYGGTQQPNSFATTFLFPRQLWVLDLAAGSGWESRAIPPSGPPGLAGACLTADPDRRRLLLFGGRDSLGVPHAELWAYGIDTDTWSLLTPLGPAPAARYEALMVHDIVRDRMVLTSGRLDAMTYQRDTWALSLADPPVWSLLENGASTTGGPVVGAIDPVMDRLVVIKGLGPPVPSSSDSVRRFGSWWLRSISWRISVVLSFSTVTT